MYEDVPSTAIEGLDSPAGVLVAVFGAKGGCGTTTVATNVASALAAKHRVLLIDLDVGGGSVASSLDLTSGKSINTVLDRLANGDEQMVLGAADVMPNGLHVLAQPYDLTELMVPQADSTNRLLEFARRGFDIVVVDAGSKVQVSSLATLVDANEILLVSNLDVGAVRGAQRTIKLLQMLDFPTDRVHLIMNKVGPGSALSMRDIEGQLDLEVRVQLERDDAACAAADAEGRPLEHVAPRARLTRQLVKLWDNLHAPPTPEKKTHLLQLPWRWSSN